MEKTGITKRIILAACAALILPSALFSCETQKNEKGSDQDISVDEIKYVTDYPLKLWEHACVLGKWDIWKNNHPGIESLYIYNINSYKSSDLKDHFNYKVFDSKEIAKQVYESDYKETKSISDNKWDKGKNWFIGTEPGVCDAYIIWMCCLEDNVIIEVDLSHLNAWNYKYDEKDSEKTKDSELDTETIKDYLIEHSSELKDFVISELMDENNIDKE